MMRQGRTPSFVTRASSSPMEHVSVVSCSRSSRRFDMADEPCVRRVRDRREEKINGGTRGALRDRHRAALPVAPRAAADNCDASAQELRSHVRRHRRVRARAADHMAAAEQKGSAAGGGERKRLPTPARLEAAKDTVQLIELEARSVPGAARSRVTAAAQAALAARRRHRRLSRRARKPPRRSPTRSARTCSPAATTTAASTTRASARASSRTTSGSRRGRAS